MVLQWGRTAMPGLMVLLMFSTALVTPLPRYLKASRFVISLLVYQEDSLWVSGTGARQFDPEAGLSKV